MCCRSKHNLPFFQRIVKNLCFFKTRNGTNKTWSPHTMQASEFKPAHLHAKWVSMCSEKLHDITESTDESLASCPCRRASLPWDTFWSTEIGCFFFPPPGQPVCRGGTQRPCYKVIYFHDASRRLNFEEANTACRRDGAQLVSIESEDEQRLIEKFIENLLASDGDFWIGLRRREEKQSNSTACQDLYTWTDGSTATFR